MDRKGLCAEMDCDDRAKGMPPRGAARSSAATRTVQRTVRQSEDCSSAAPLGGMPNRSLRRPVGAFSDGAHACGQRVRGACGLARGEVAGRADRAADRGSGCGALEAGVRRCGATRFRAARAFLGRRAVLPARPHGGVPRRIDGLRARGFVYPCFCTRADLHAASAPHRGEKPVYPGTCRHLSDGERAARSQQRTPAQRLAVPDRKVAFVDQVQGPYAQDLAQDCGDFLVRRSDGAFAYQLAVVVDDAEQGVNSVVRGVDLLCSTPQQIYLQELLGLPHPAYAHVPLLVAERDRRLSKRDRDGALDALLPSASDARGRHRARRRHHRPCAFGAILPRPRSCWTASTSTRCLQPSKTSCRCAGSKACRHGSAAFRPSFPALGSERCKPPFRLPRTRAARLRYGERRVPGVRA